MISIEAPELQRRLANGEDWFLLDVREPSEAVIASLPNSTLIPLGLLHSLLHRVPHNHPRGLPLPPRNTIPARLPYPRTIRFYRDLESGRRHPRVVEIGGSFCADLL